MRSKTKEDVALSNKEQEQRTTRQIFYNFLLAFGPTIFLVAFEGGKFLLCGELDPTFRTCVIIAKTQHATVGQLLVDAGFIASGPTLWVSWKVMSFKRFGEVKHLQE